MISRPHFPCRSNLLREIVVTRFSVWRTAEEGHDVVQVGIIDLHRHVTAKSKKSARERMEKGCYALHPGLNTIRVPFGEERRLEYHRFCGHELVESSTPSVSVYIQHVFILQQSSAHAQHEGGNTDLIRFVQTHRRSEIDHFRQKIASLLVALNGRTTKARIHIRLVHLSEIHRLLLDRSLRSVRHENTLLPFLLVTQEM